jgi:hypothetical protein
MSTQRADCIFSPKDLESSTGAHWIMIELHDKIDALPHNTRVIGLELKGFSAAHTDEVAEYWRR